MPLQIRKLAIPDDRIGTLLIPDTGALDGEHPQMHNKKRVFLQEFKTCKNTRYGFSGNSGRSTTPP